jgi:hypothetical protein
VMIERGRFYDIGGRRYPSVTTVLGVINKPWLNEWRGDLGNEEADRVSGEAADTGSDFHDLGAAFNRTALMGLSRTILIPAPTPQLACMMAAYAEWFDRVVERVLAVEEVVYHPTYGYAGTYDLLAVLKGDATPTVIDLKTSRAIYPEHGLQLGAYQMALAFAGRTQPHPKTRRLVIRVDKAEPGLLQVREYENHTHDQRGFLAALALWTYMEEANGHGRRVA